MRYYASVSFGKDSLAMLFMLIETSSSWITILGELSCVLSSIFVRIPVKLSEGNLITLNETSHFFQRAMYSSSRFIKLIAFIIINFKIKQ